MAYSQYFKGNFSFLPPQACMVDVTPPTFAGISALSQNTDGSLSASWSAGTDTDSPIRYEVYVQSATATGLFNTVNIQQITNNTSTKIYFDGGSLGLQTGQTYFVGVRAVDSIGNRETNTVSLSQLISNINYNSIPGQVWEQLPASHNTVNTFGANLQSKVDVNVSTRNSTAHFDSVIGTPAGASVSADIAEIEAETDGIAAIPTNPLLTTDARLNNLDATISSRNSTAHFDTVIGTPAGASVSADIAEIESETDGIAAIPTNPLLTNDVRLNDLDAAISSRAPSATALSTVQWTNVRAALLDFLDVAVSSRLAAASYVAPDNADIASIKVQTDKMLFDGSSFIKANAEITIDDPNIAAIKAKTDQLLFNVDTGVVAHVINVTPVDYEAVADAVWDEGTAEHVAPGTFGENAQTPSINPQQVANAVWDEPIASHLTIGSTGKKLNDGTTGGGKTIIQANTSLMGTVKSTNLSGNCTNIFQLIGRVTLRQNITNC